MAVVSRCGWPPCEALVEVRNGRVYCGDGHRAAAYRARERMAGGR